MAKNKNTSLKVATVLVVLIFLAAGLPKIFVWREWLWRFAWWEYPKWLLIVVGIVETAGALAVLVPRTAFVGTLALGAVMVGAFVTHFMNREGVAMLGPAIMLVLLYVIFKNRKPRNLLGRFRGSAAKKKPEADA